MKIIQWAKELMFWLLIAVYIFGIRHQVDGVPRLTLDILIIIAAILSITILVIKKRQA